MHIDHLLEDLHTMPVVSGVVFPLCLSGVLFYAGYWLAISDYDELAGLTFVFTGSLTDLTREEAQDHVERKGANTTGSVSGNTDYLVAGSNPGQSKQDAAADEDVPILSEKEFREEFMAED